MDKIILYTTHCPKCRVIEKKLAQKNIQYEEVDAKGNNEIIDMLSEKGFRQMPILAIGDNFLGFTEANKWIGEQ